MKKDAYYFPHFCNARHDRKIKRLQKDLGLEGYGIFFMLLEVLREQTDFKYPYVDIDLLADEFGTSTAKIEAVINVYDLFTFDENRNFFSTRLIFYLQPYLEKTERSKKANEIRWTKYKELQNFDPNGIQMDIQMESKWNPNQNPSKVKESKVKESKVNIKKSIYGEFSHVSLTHEEYLKLYSEYQNAEELIKFLDEYIEMKGYKAKSHYLCIKKWVADAVNERKNKKSGETKDNVFTEIGRDMGIW